MWYLISCVVAYTAAVVFSKYLGVLPAIETINYRDRKGEVDFHNTAFIMLMMAGGALMWPISIPVAGLYLYVINPKKEKEQ